MRVPVIAALLLCLVMAADAKNGGKGRKHPHGGGAPAVQVNLIFGGGDLGLIRNYYGARQLPPGIQKQLLRKGTLPPGIAKKIAPFPVELDRRLPPLPDGVYRGYYGGAAVLYDPVARIIYDVADIVVNARRL